MTRCGDFRRQHDWLRCACPGGGVRPVAPGPFRGQAPGLEDIDVIDNKRNPTKREIEKADRTGEAPDRLRLREILDTALDEPGTIFSFMDRLEAVGVTVRPNGASTGRFNGFAFDGIPFKFGSSFGSSSGSSFRSSFGSSSGSSS